MSVTDIVRDYPLRMAAGILTSLGVIIGAAFTIDERYAHAGDIKELKISQEAAVIQQRLDIRNSNDMLRKQIIEDKIFEIELTPPNKRTQIDNARLEKYKREVQEINQRWIGPTVR